MEKKKNEEKEKDLSAKSGIAAKPLANVFEVYLSKRETPSGRKFFNESDMLTAVYLANKRVQR